MARSFPWVEMPRSYIRGERLLQVRPERLEIDNRPVRLELIAKGAQTLQLIIM
ncbi:hypothetical protein [Brucella tritici]|uniref:hypothetical protein n=1 Tax=Brucella tritici TaxID=94626 RepID=UPI00159085DF|nr:hypothetical protein [Brucella tritici]